MRVSKLGFTTTHRNEGGSIETLKIDIINKHDYQGVVTAAIRKDELSDVCEGVNRMEVILDISDLERLKNLFGQAIEMLKEEE